MRLEQFPVVVFDLDDTLYLEHDYVLSGFRAVGDWLHHECDWTPAESTEFVATCGKLFQSGQRGDIFDHAMDAVVRQSKTRPAIIDLVQCYRSHEPEIALQPDAKQLLDLLLPKHQLWVITDGPLISQQRKVAALQLSRWTDRVIYTDEWGQEYWKPSPRAFEHVCDESGFEPSECVYLADNPTKDFVAPTKLGWGSLRIRRPQGLHTNLENDPAHAPDWESEDFLPFCRQFDVEDG